MNPKEINVDNVIDSILDYGDQKIIEYEAELARSTIKKLIIIKGEPNVGKTTVCRSILQLLLIDGASIDGDDPDFKGDFTAKLSYKGIKVAICSMGDKLSAVEENIRNYNKCDVVIVASRNFVSLGKILCDRTSIHTKVLSDYAGHVVFAKKIIADILQE
jgi:hypothetical protein